MVDYSRFDKLEVSDDDEPIRLDYNEPLRIVRDGDAGAADAP
eukprot:CAMPEP_0119285858 /NCGR_PEP_ID=MMETSP1329-20130426/32922_1 /TAXON_ID=114041 /ORGANISM="Genus nov. species nov., Strain RCC1024" /LENGTH=41 /DNA_ID= /DNA_START= /DNA_END= /DNA_ORIENTATION=